MNDPILQKHADSIMNASNLDDLADAIEAARDDNCDSNDLQAAGVDWPGLPTFGAEPEDTAEVWSWDDARLLLIEGMMVELTERD